MEIVYSLVSILNEMSPYILLGFLIAGIMHAFIPQRVFARHLAGRGWKSVVKSAAIGVPLPLCSCGVLPTAIGMRRNGASKASTTSFLIATPQTGMDSIAATWSLLGPAFAIIRPIAALVTAFFGGVAVGKAEADEPMARAEACSAVPASEVKKSFVEKIIAALRYGFIELVGSIGSWLIVGLIIAALITVYVPADALASLGSRPLLAMIVVLLVAIPMYVCATGSIPIAMSLMIKGLSPGTALVLLMAGPAANFASFALISREMGRKSALIYLTSIIIGAVGFGLLIDYVLPAYWFDRSATAAACCHSEMTWPLFPTICSAILVSLLGYTFIQHRKSHYHHKLQTTDMTVTYNIEGMNCNHCRATVEKAIASTPGVDSVSVDLDSAKAVVSGSASADSVMASVHAAGFSASLA
ncbi:MAG: SO_0444 family Cu/Zn efflux transporter [Muribaculaceae bacterium]|nr:SO_0444 family Cu/Zn efflux transporter [Muribaculaceae bacterium]MDE7111679.1 SO_0444 family Cu/Zn efflux transporter [Muribaculaceae bacterium]